MPNPAVAQQLQVTAPLVPSRQNYVIVRLVRIPLACVMERDAKKKQKVEPAPAPRRILFIGNSFTARNDVPGLIADMARQRGFQVQTELVSRGGASLKQHWNAGALGMHEKDPFDAVVLQEQSTLPAKNEARFHDNVRLFAKAVTNAQLVLYSTWARADEPEKQQSITDAYARIAAEARARVAPVGSAFAALQAAGVALHDKDKSHANMLGSYVAACVFFATIFGQSPVGLECAKIKDKLVLEQLQQAAAKAAL